MTKEPILTLENVRHLVLSAIDLRPIGAGELRKRFNMNTREYTKLIKDGMPHIGYGHKKRFYFADVVDWLAKKGYRP